MSETEDQPLANEASTGASTDQEAPRDPVQGAKDDAWLAQFRADNAAAVMQHNYAASEKASADAKAALTERDDDLMKAERMRLAALDAHREAADFEKKAQADAARHDEYELRAQVRSHTADEEDALSETFSQDAEREDNLARADRKDSDELFTVYQRNSEEYRILQSEAVAAQRIATDEEHLHQMIDAPTDEAGAGPPEP